LLLASFNMYSDQKAKKFVYEDSFEKLSMMIQDEMIVCNQEAYSRPIEKAEDLV
jgi:hypothetical protein